MTAPGGIMSMHGTLHYRPIVLRDCTTNVETADTVANFRTRAINKN